MLHKSYTHQNRVATTRINAGLYNYVTIEWE